MSSRRRRETEDDKMAANSGGAVDWPTVLGTLGAPPAADDGDRGRNQKVLDVCGAIIASEPDLLLCEGFSNFYDSFALLSSDYVIRNARNLSLSQLEVTRAACRVLLEYFAVAVRSMRADASPIKAEKYLKAVRVLCLGKDFLDAADVATLTVAMKEEPLPANINVSHGEKESGNKPEPVKARTDLSSAIFEQLTMPLRETDGDAAFEEGSGTGKGSLNDTMSVNEEPITEITKILLKANTESLQALRVADTLVDLCLNLPNIKKAKIKIDEALAGKPFVLPVTHTEATAIRNSLSSMSSDMSLASKALRLPALEPLTASKLDRLCGLGAAALYCAVGQASAGAVLAACSHSGAVPRDDEDAGAVALVEEALEVYEYIGDVVRGSTRAGGHVYQNYLLSGAWVLISGLQTHLSACVSEKAAGGHSRDLRERDEKTSGRSPSKSQQKDSTTTSSGRYGYLKSQQAFGVLSVALVGRCLELLSELFQDLHSEVCGTTSEHSIQVDPAPISIMGQFAALQRVSRLLNSAPLIQLLFHIALISYRKACALKRIHPPEGDIFSQSDSTTYYEDLIMCSEENSTEDDDDEDSEPILGLWFEETVAPAENATAASAVTSETKNPETKVATTPNAPSNSVVPETGEAGGFITLATKIFLFMNRYLLNSKSSHVTRYLKAGLSEQQIIVLASIIRDLDRETARTEVGTIPGCFGQALGRLYCEFSGALARFTHNLVTHASLQGFQVGLLNHLGVSPWNADVPHAWPLQVYPRTLSVLSQVLLLRPQNEKEASVISIWHRLVNTLIENVMNPSSETSDNEDLNVEHAQVLLYLFHLLNLMQKKSVLLLLASAILRCSEVARNVQRDSQLLHISRLLLLFDYIMKHLYDAPAELLEQIQWNLFYATNLNTDKDKENNTSRMYVEWKEMEDGYRKAMVGSEEAGMKPRFYAVTAFEIKNQEPPKLDGLACNFILGTPDKIRYPLLLDGLIEILNVTQVTSGAQKISFLGLCATQYCFTICLKLIQILPPSATYIERLATDDPPINIDSPSLLHSLIWGPRANHRVFQRWLKDCLSKQGVAAQHSDRVLRECYLSVARPSRDAAIFERCVSTLIRDKPLSLFETIVLDVTLGKLRFAISEDKTQSEGDILEKVVPSLLTLIQGVLTAVNKSLTDDMMESEKSIAHHLKVLSISSTKNNLISTLTEGFNELLPPSIIKVLTNWNLITLDDDNSLSAFSDDIIPSENYILRKIEAHISSLSVRSPFSMNSSLKKLLNSSVKFLCEHSVKITNEEIKSNIIDLMICLTLDVRTEFLYDTVFMTLVEDIETIEHQMKVYLKVLDNSYELFTNSSDCSVINEKLLHNYLRFYEKSLDTRPGRMAFEIFFGLACTVDQDLIKVLMSVSNPQTSSKYGTRVLEFFNKLCNQSATSGEKNSQSEPNLSYLSENLNRLTKIDEDSLKLWLTKLIIGENTEEIENSKQTQPNSPIQENVKLLQSLSNFIVKQPEIKPEVPLIILNALIFLGETILIQSGESFTDLMVIMTTLADSGSGKGHKNLVQACAKWMSICLGYFSSEDNTIEESGNSNGTLDATNSLLEYLTEVISSLSSGDANRTARVISPVFEIGENLTDNDYPDEILESNEGGGEDEETDEDSDEDSLCNKLCTFTVTQKEFMNQHWYHCHTCRMLDGVGVCSVCARVCHKGHDLSYAKYGNFFCDCGAKEDGSCLALTKRERDPVATVPADNLTHPSTLRRRTSSPEKTVALIKKDRKSPIAVKQLEGSREELIAILKSSDFPTTLLTLLNLFKSPMEKFCEKNSPIGCHNRALKALNQLQTVDKNFLYTDQLMLPTLGSQEGAFENVRMSFAGEQGQTIRQLLSAHIVRRVAMCCMHSTHGKRQHLAVSHEKGKITVLQLSALLKQTDSSTRKLTLTRLSSAPIPFTVLSLSSNLCNENYLSVCGLKDCHVLTFNSNGSVSDHLVLHPQLETGNFIIKSLWLPGSQTQLALVTADFVKVYDLAVDAVAPQFHFLVPSGKIRDCTFMCAPDSAYSILLMSSPGHIYCEVLGEESSAKHGAFYVTNTLEVFHLDVTDVNGQVAGGGVSIHYSHTLGLLFYSYANGKSFVSPITPKNNCLTTVFSINLPTPSAASAAKPNNGNKTTTGPQPLCQWTEIPNHPGLVCCTMQASNNPVILMIRPESISIQEIKVAGAKAKITDMVAIRHNSINEKRTTLILMCEDGSLKIYIANMQETGFWMSPEVRASTSPTGGASSGRAKRPKKAAAVKGKSSGTSNAFPVDFFEHCQPMNDVEIGGNDLLQVYNVAQLKHRLNTTGLYVVCTKPLGFTVEITNSDDNMVITGVRVLVGSQDATRAPSFVEIFGRIVPISVHRGRWYDVPLSREESLRADKKLSVTFGPSQDPETVTMLDSIKVYGKTKDIFGWPEDPPEETEGRNATPSVLTSGNQNDVVVNGTNGNGNAVVPLSNLERVVVGILEVMDAFGSFGLFDSSENGSFKSTSVKLAMEFLTMPTPSCIQLYSKSLLASLHQTKQSYHNYKDSALLQHVLESLNAMSNPSEIDAENYFRLVSIVRTIAVSRPGNLIKFAVETSSTSSKTPNLLSKLTEVLWALHSLNPENPSLVPVVVPGLKHTERVVSSLVEIAHAFDASDPYSGTAVSVYLQLLLCGDATVAFGARRAVCRVLRPKDRAPRRVCLPSPARRCGSPSKAAKEAKDADAAAPRAAPAASREPAPSRFDADAAEAMALLQPAAVAAAAADEHNVNLEALLGGGAGVGFPPLLDIPPDADDETMVELAIALSLQEHGLGGAEQPQVLGAPAMQPPGQPASQEAGHFSDTTASAAGSDDEGSTAATDGSTLRTSPAEQGGSAGSESGGSGAESIAGEHSVSGRSSAYGDTAPGRAATTSYQDSADPDTNDAESGPRLHVLRLQLLERFVEHLPKLRDIGGVRVVPFFQVVLQLTTDLDGHSERDKNCLNLLLTAIINELEINVVSSMNVSIRTKQREVQLVIMRLLSVLMSRCKTSSGSTRTSPSDHTVYISQATATALHKADIINLCLKLLQSLLEYWRGISEETSDATTTTTNNLLKEHLRQPPPDMNPFFLKQFVKGHAADIFQTYPQLLTEMALRLPYQVHKYSEVSEPVAAAFDSSWYRYLCEYMMTSSQTPFLRRQVRKLLQFICGSKEKYRQLRDVHALNTHIKAVKKCCAKGGYNASIEIQYGLSLTYDALVELVEHLKSCLEIAVGRTGNWQKFCIHHEDVIPFLFQVSCLLDEGVAPTILHLLNCAIVLSSPSTTTTTTNGTNGSKKTTDSTKPTPSSSSRKDREKSDDSAAEALFEESNCLALVEQINKQVSRDVLTRFVRTFVLETNSTLVRWQAHSLIVSIYKNSPSSEQSTLLDLLWGLWPCLPAYGRKAAQFVDLLGYFSLKFSKGTDTQRQISEYVERAVSVLRTQNELLSHHPNANLYNHMSQYLELEGYYLESEPCLVCNNPEVPLSTIKLSSVKVDSKFTTTTQIVKLLSSHTISKITVRIADLKRTKMVRTINVYYNNRTVQAVVELKNKPSLWHKAKRVSLQSGQTEVRIEFPLPIVACNLMIEYSDFYENLQASSETLQCPRCSAAVPSNPGVCSNCGENVFQCHKCRAINYDEKDPFLCHACGFCKYAKFDFTLHAKPCCAVEAIETDDDRKKTVAGINSLLEKADRVYKQLMGNKPNLEALISRITERKSDRKSNDDTTSTSFTTAAAVNAAQSALLHGKVNKTIQMLAQQYCGECKLSFEELSKIIQRVLVSRKELVAYDRRHRDKENNLSGGPTDSSSSSNTSSTPTNKITGGRCYGCSSAATEHCLTLLRALALNPKTRELLCSKGLIQDLLWNNLRRGSTQLQEDVRQLLCVLSKDNESATEELCASIKERISTSLNGYVATTDLASSICHEMALLAALLNLKDGCREMRLRLLAELFLKACEDTKNPVVIESIILPCLKIWYDIVKPTETATSTNGTTKKSVKEKLNSDLSVSVVKTSQSDRIGVDIYKWLEKDPEHTYSKWKQAKMKQQALKKSDSVVLPKNKSQVRKIYLSEKYMRKWKEKTYRNRSPPTADFNVTTWIKAVLFNPSSRLARQVTCNIFEYCSGTFERKLRVLSLLTRFLEELCSSGESSAEFLALYQNLIRESPWKQYLTVRGVLLTLANLITREIEQLHYLEETTLTSDLTQGYALNQLTELLSSFLDDPAIRRQYKGKLVGAVLNGYLSLRRLVVQRTRLIDDTQEKLLELLEEMTTGTEEETRAFMVVCMETVEKCSLRDILTPVFVFERLCSIIYPEENDVGEFFLTLDKDPQQEDFLQGRMLGNPYSSLETGLGPLMRDVKNKICQDCELVALLEDDNGMELLVNNKIMGLDLAVRDVYKRVWLAEGNEPESMRVVYRMRGLLGDATEEFVETLGDKAPTAVDDEEVYKMANILAECGGLQIMVRRLGAVQNVVRAKPLLHVLLKLFRVSVKVVRVQEVLIRPELGTMGVFLRILRLCLDTEGDSSQSGITEQLLDIMETILSKATSQPPEMFEKFSETFGSPEYIESLLKYTNAPTVKNNQAVQGHLMHVLACLVYGNSDRMRVLMGHFAPVLDFDKYDSEHTADDQRKLELFCTLTNGIDPSPTGATLKDHVISRGVLADALAYISTHAPCVKPTLLRTDSDELKEFIARPALKHILRILTGMADGHENTQLAIAQADAIPIIHRLEQVSSDEHVGSLAENLLEALRANPTVASCIEEAREFTRSEKKRLAMAMREKQLGQLGMRTNDKGQVTAKSAILQQMEELGEETGLVCCICREGYKYQPTKVLGIYTFTKRCNVEEFESKKRKTVGYSTVTHFNVVHIDCHISAVRLARTRDEWESAALQNANTKCNGLLPLWGPQVPESAFASCLARHNAYLQEGTGCRDVGHASTVHDLKLLLLRFATERPFHEDTGGGGPQSNMHAIPYLIHMALYEINATRVGKKEETATTAYLESNNSENWIESSYEAEGPLYWLTMSLLVHSSKTFDRNRVSHLKRLIVLAQTRRSNPTGPIKTLGNKSEEEYSAYKSYLVFFGLIDGIYRNFFKGIAATTSDESWPSVVADYIRHNDEALLKASESLLSSYTDELLPCTSFVEFCDVTGLLDVITSPETFIQDLLKGL